MNSINLTEILGTVKFRAMSTDDREGFAGASESALIGESEEHVIIIEKETIHFVNEDGEETVFTVLKEKE